MKAIVTEVQVCGGRLFNNLRGACKEYLHCLQEGIDREKLSFRIVLPDKTIKHITIRQESNELVAYGDFEGLPNMLDYAKEVTDEPANQRTDTMVLGTVWISSGY